MSTYVTESTAADYLKISIRTLQRFRVEGSGPRYRKAGRRVLYAIADIELWLNANSFNSTSEAKAAGGVS